MSHTFIHVALLFAGMFLGWMMTQIEHRRYWRLYIYLRECPGWHYGLDLVKSEIVDRSSVYIYLHRLQEMGLVESQEGEKTYHGIPPRMRYRATMPARTAIDGEADGR